jgi:putative ABC transport system ATP-binding protein
MDIKIADVRVRPAGLGNDLFRIKHLAIPFGTKLLIRGPSGCGKTSLLHLMAGLLVPSEGMVLLGDYALGAMSDERRCRLRRDCLGMVFQRLNLLDQLTAVENVLLGLRDAGDPRGRAMAALGRVDLAELSERRCGKLSLGEQQRVAVARVLAARPAVTLADEPTSNLDDRNVEKVVEALFEASREGTLVVVSHDSRIRSHFDRVLDFEKLVV